MYLHIGAEKVVANKEVILILNLKNNRPNYSINSYLKVLENSKDIEYVDHNKKINSCVITKNKVYYSPIAAATLKKRVAEIYG